MTVSFYVGNRLQQVSADRPRDLEAFVERFEREHGVIADIYEGDVCLYRSAITLSDIG